MHFGKGPWLRVLLKPGEGSSMAGLQSHMRENSGLAAVGVFHTSVSPKAVGCLEQRFSTRDNFSPL